MEKIVLLTDYPEKFDSLIAHLNMLFPECEIQVCSKQIAEFQNTPATLESLCGREMIE